METRYSDLQESLNKNKQVVEMMKTTSESMIKALESLRDEIKLKGETPELKKKLMDLVVNLRSNLKKP